MSTQPHTPPGRASTLPPLSRERLRLLRSLQSRKVRQRRGLCLVEGERTLGEALGAGVVQFLVVAEGGAPSPGAGDVPAFELDAEAFEEATGLATAQGTIGVARIPQWSADDLPRSGAPSLLLYLDGVQDPSNVGALVRSAWALGADGVLLSPGTADPFGPKAVRASAGGVFRLPVVGGVDAGSLAALAEEGYQVFLAEAGGMDFAGVPLGRRTLLVLGNEASGISQEVARLGRALSVPMAAGADSLNVVVAGSILAAAMARVRRAP